MPVTKREIQPQQPNGRGPEPSARSLLQRRLHALHRREGSWARVSDLLGVSKGRAYMMAMGRRKADEKMLAAIQEQASSDPGLLRAVRRIAVPFLDGREGFHG